MSHFTIEDPKVFASSMHPLETFSSTEGDQGGILLTQKKATRDWQDTVYVTWSAHLSVSATNSVKSVSWIRKVQLPELNQTVLKISHQGLMQHCSQCRPSQGLLKDLSEFDFEGYLDMPFSTFPSVLSRTMPFYVLPSFYDWIRVQVWSPLYLTFLLDIWVASLDPKKWQV